jgi:galactokinase
MIERFRQVFGSAQGVHVFRAPGRVNLIGEHTDYNMGFVCPVALQLATYTAIAPGTGNKLRIYSEHAKEMREFPVDGLRSLTAQKHWTDYPVGVARELEKLGFGILPADLYIRSTVPEGSGLSSSAALEVSTALAILSRRPVAPLQLAKLCQDAETGFVGMPCGIMDQFISIFGREGAAVELDCRSLERREVALPDGVTFVAVNSMVKHELGSSAYRERVAECAAAVEGLRQSHRHVESLRDVSPIAFEESAPTLPEVIRKRARHVVTENARVRAFMDASGESDLEMMGRLMVESHRSLQYDYEVSCAELDFLVDQALTLRGVHGARMTGGGFGGCTVTMVENDAVAGFRSAITAAYGRKFKIVPKIYECIPSQGAGECKRLERFPDIMRP